jgi:methionine synthase I (cobalamin-dependent)
MSKILRMDEFLIEKASQSIDGIRDMVQESIENMNEEDLSIFLNETLKELDGIVDSIKKLEEKNNE